MSIQADCHLHSYFSGDSEAPMEDMILAGLRQGLRRMCFTEHLDLDFPVSLKHPEDTFTIDSAAYRAEFNRCRAKYRGKMELAMGVELGLQPHVAAENQAFLEDNAFDFVIGSSHAYDGIDPCQPENHVGRTEREICEEYFRSIIRNIRTFDDFDVFGHLDYILRYIPAKDRNFSFCNYRDYYDTIFRMLLDRGKGIEVNTGGLIKGLREPHPCIEALRRYRALGGEILTIGSDGHKAENVGGCFLQVRDILIDCGFRRYAFFRDRKPQWFDL